jgi:NAD(P)-dependent dehydrogenase (short-subunit alcohol dehydrogenase family)
MNSSAHCAVVTGSSSGIGLAIAQRLLTSGYRVVINYSIDDDRAEDALAECRKISPHVVLEKADVAYAEQAKRLVTRAITEFGRGHRQARTRPHRA